MSDAGNNFISERFEKFCRMLNIEHAALSSYDPQSNGQVKACIKLVKYTMKKCCDTKSDIHLALLQVRMMPVGPGPPSPATLLFNHPTMGIMPIINRVLISKDNDDECHKTLVKDKQEMIRNMILPKIVLFSS